MDLTCETLARQIEDRYAEDAINDTPVEKAAWGFDELGVDIVTITDEEGNVFEIKIRKIK